MKQGATMKPRFAYAGIGARDTPEDIQDLMRAAAEHLSSEGMVLRSGGAGGADTAFESGADPDLKEIYIPFDSFNGRDRSTKGIIPPQFLHPKAVAESFEIAAAHHPAWDKLNQTVRFIMARNSYQILGADLRSPAMFVLCYTPGGKGGGGTGQAIRIANTYDIPVYDLGLSDTQHIEKGINYVLTNTSDEQKKQAMVPF